jgi:hypothetical protein
VTILSLRGSERDKSTSEVDEGQVALGTNFPPDSKSAVVVVPAVGAFHDPTTRLLAADRPSQSWFTTPSYVRSDVPELRFAFALVIVVSLVQAKVLWTTRASRCADYNGVERRADHMHVVHVGAREGHRDRDATTVGQYAPFRAEFGAIGRIGPGKVPPFGAFTLALSSDAQASSTPRSWS